MAGYIGSKSAGLISGIDASVAELNLNDKSSANGTTEANKVLTADANKDVTAIRNLTATGTVTRALARGSIDVGNSSGVSSALATGAAGTVLTSDGTDLSFAAASGGGEQEFVATGAISNGNIVGLNANGTVSVLEAAFFTPVNYGNSAFANHISANFDPDTNKILISYRPEVTNYPTVVVGTVSGNSISFGKCNCSKFVVKPQRVVKPIVQTLLKPLSDFYHYVISTISHTSPVQAIVCIPDVLSSIS